MWAALALTTVMQLGPAQGSDLGVTNVRATYGILGQRRTDKKLLPGDLYVVAFDIVNLKVKDDGRIAYAMGMELRRQGKDKPEFKRDPQDLEAINTLGGTTLPAFARAAIGTDAQPGQWTLKVTIRDRTANKTVVLEEKFEVVKPTFGFVQLYLTSLAMEPTPPVGVPGQAMLLHCTLTGYQKKPTPLVNFEMVVYDENNKPTLTKSFQGDIDSEPKSTPGLIMLQPITLQLNRPGKFKVVLRAMDKHSKQKVEQALDLEVLKR